MVENETAVEELAEVADEDLADLSDAAESAILDGGGFGWLNPPPRAVLSRYFRGVILIPERHLFVGRLDKRIVASVQLQEPARNNEAQAHAAILTALFVAPWARGHRLAARLVQAVEKKAKALGYYNLTLDIRSTQESAIQLYEGQGFKRWGTNPAYAFVDESLVSGHYYSKELRKIHCKTRRKKEA
tara:strand:+ start:1146 stop:1706 length:561 start_codon:yes stop_codon:yes gene_type:complete